MRDAIDVLIVIALALQMLANTAVLLCVVALLTLVLRQLKPSTKVFPAPVLEQPWREKPAPINPCDHCQAELGDPESSRIMGAGEATVMIYKCPKCSLPTERQV